MVGFKRVALLAILAVLLLPQAGHALTGGAGIDVVDGDATFDSTEVTGAETWSDGSTDASVTWTWDLSSGTDPGLKFSDGSIGIEAGEITGGDDAGDTLTILGTSGTPSGAGGDVVIGDETNGVQWNEDTSTFEVISGGGGSIVATTVSGSAADGSRFIQFQQNTHTNEPAFPTDSDSVRLYCEKDFFGVSSGDDACFFRHTGDSGSEDRILKNDENGVLIKQITAPGAPPGPDQDSSEYTSLYSTSSDDLWIHPEGGSAQQVCTSSTLGSCTNPDTAAAISGTAADGSRLLDIEQNDTEPSDPGTDDSRYYCHKDDIATGVDSCYIRHDGDDDNGGRILVEDEDDGVILKDITAPGAAPASGYNAVYSNSGTLYMHPNGGSATQICTAADISGCSAGGGGGPTRKFQTSTLTHSGGTTIENSSDLSFTLSASTSYMFNGVLIPYGPSGGSDVKVELDCTAGGSTAGEVYFNLANEIDGGGSSNAGSVAIGTAHPALAGGAIEWYLPFSGYITANGSGCTLQVGYAENSDGSGVAELRVGSWMQISEASS